MCHNPVFVIMIIYENNMIKKKISLQHLDYVQNGADATRIAIHAVCDVTLVPCIDNEDRTRTW